MMSRLTTKVAIVTVLLRHWFGDCPSVVFSDINSKSGKAPLMLLVATRTLCSLNVIYPI